MRPNSRTKLIIAAALVLGSVAAAEARDLCISLPASVGFGPDALVGKDFTIPSRNRCKPFLGFLNGASRIVVGAGCTNADGTLFRLSITANAVSLTNSTSPFHANCVIPRETLTDGSCTTVSAVSTAAADELFGNTLTDISARPCNVDVP